MKTIILTAALLAGILLCLEQLSEIADAAPLTSCEIAERVFEPEHITGEPCRVLQCESSGNRWARNGQYLGLFQLGAFARGRYLRGPWFGSWANARAALAYYRAAGGWGPWTCGWAA